MTELVPEIEISAERHLIVSLSGPKILASPPGSAPRLIEANDPTLPWSF